MHHMHAWYPGKSEEIIRSPGTRITYGCDSPRGCRELNLEPQQDQQVLCTTEPTLPKPLLPGTH